MPNNNQILPPSKPINEQLSVNDVFDNFLPMEFPDNNNFNGNLTLKKTFFNEKF